MLFEPRHNVNVGHYWPITIQHFLAWADCECRAGHTYGSPRIDKEQNMVMQNPFLQYGNAV